MAQDAPKFTVQVGSDSILLGNYFEVKFILENAKGRNFSAPEFENFSIVGGPNQSSSFSMINGEVSQSLSYSYFLQPISEGNFYIEPASIEVDGSFLESAPMEIIVAPNPDGIIQNPNQEQLRNQPLIKEPWNSKPPEKREKKRKTYKL